MLFFSIIACLLVKSLSLRNKKILISKIVTNTIINDKQYHIQPIPKNKAQEEYVSYLNNRNISIVGAIGSAGTGKTLFACHAAINALNTNIIDRIIISRPIVSVSNENIGHLPGDIKDKMNPWMLPIYDVFLQYYTQKEIHKKIEDGIISISPLGFMRGRTFTNCYIILDEAQNATPEQLLMIMTRIGSNCKLIITGDLYQSDLRAKNGLHDFLERSVDNVVESDPIRIVQFTKEDVQRSMVVKCILRIYKCM
jgi:phosphate starvation-inducible PhoH-like protein